MVNVKDLAKKGEDAQFLKTSDASTHSPCSLGRETEARINAFSRHGFSDSWPEQRGVRRLRSAVAVSIAFGRNDVCQLYRTKFCCRTVLIKLAYIDPAKAMVTATADCPAVDAPSPFRARRGPCLENAFMRARFATNRDRA